MSSEFARGSNALAVGQYNERLILQLIRRAGSLPKAEIARTTRLSPQTVSVIINRLLGDRLLRKQPRQREKGKVGQPAVPIALNPAGAYSIGVKLGRRSLEILLVDFTGSVLRRFSHHYDHPQPEQVFAWIERDVRRLGDELGPDHRERLVGIGAVAPYTPGGWQQRAGAPASVLACWNRIDIGRRLGAAQPLPVWFANDATAACIAELEFGGAARFQHFLYVFVGTFIHGGVVLNGSLYSGGFDNAGAVGSMPVPSVYAAEAVPSGAATVPLLACASRYLLDDRLRAAGFEPESALAALAEDQTATPAVAAIFDAWLQRAGAAIACALAAAVSVIDFQGVVIDGALPPRLVRRLVEVVGRQLARLDLEGLMPPELVAGAIGSDARALGGAMLPFYSSFAPDRDVLLKLGAEKTAPA